MMHRLRSGLLFSAFLLFLAGPTFAERPPESGFFEDYSLLEPAAAPWIDYIYVTEKYAGEMAEVRAIILPQPELFLSPDSQYKGMKPDNMKMITDSMRQIFVETLAENYQIANSPGPNTLVLELAFSNLHLKKKPRTPVIGWLPPAYVATSLKRKIQDDFAKNVLLTELVWEGQIRDSESGEILGQVLLELGDNTKKKEFTSWDELMTAVAVTAERLRCRFENAPLIAAKQRDCLEITGSDIKIM